MVFSKFYFKIKLCLNQMTWKMCHIWNHILHTCVIENSISILRSTFKRYLSKKIFKYYTVKICGQRGICFRHKLLLLSYVSNTLLFQFFWLEKVEGMNLFFLPPIKFWFSLNKEDAKAGRQGWRREVGMKFRLGLELWQQTYVGLAKQTWHLKP